MFVLASCKASSLIEESMYCISCAIWAGPDEGIVEKVVVTIDQDKDLKSVFLVLRGSLVKRANTMGSNHTICDSTSLARACQRALISFSCSNSVVRASNRSSLG